MRRKVSLDDREILVVGTAHISEESREEVSEAFNELNPDHVFVELDEERLESMENGSGWRDMDVVEALKEGRGSLLFLNLMLAIYQRKLGLREGMEPGMELLEAVKKAREGDVEYSLVDREIGETFTRLREELSLWEKFKLLSSFTVGEEIGVEDLKEEELLDSIVKSMGDEFPGLKKTFLDERNSFMAENILEKDFERGLVVVGAAHVEGIVDQLENGVKPIQPPGKNFPWFKAFSYGFPAFIILGLAYSFWQIGFSTGLNATKFWFLTNGVLAMLGAIVARAHPLTWLTSFVAAPFTSLDPAIGAGMVAGYVEGRVYPPTVGELEDIAYLERYRDLWGNQVGRVLLTFMFVTFGSAAATFISAGYIASLIAGI